MLIGRFSDNRKILKRTPESARTVVVGDMRRGMDIVDFHIIRHFANTCDMRIETDLHKSCRGIVAGLEQHCVALGAHLRPVHTAVNVRHRLRYALRRISRAKNENILAEQLFLRRKHRHGVAALRKNQIVIRIGTVFDSLVGVARLRRLSYSLKL